MAFRDLCEQYQIRFKKQLGQNLLLDDNINRIMVEAAALTPEDDVVEVGAGMGMLTERLRHLAARVLAVEIDTMFMPCLEDRFGQAPNVRLFRGDILNHEVADLVNEHLPGARSLKLISNLPYYITTPILFHFWESPLFFSRFVVMVQEEVAVRLVAAPGSRDYGVLTLSAGLYGDADLVHRVPRTCFRPKPNVDSCIVRLRSHRESPYPDVDLALLRRVIRAAFTQRRKMLRNALNRPALLNADIDTVLAAMEEVGIAPTARAETLSLDAFANLARAIGRRTHPGRLPATDA